MSKNFKLYFSSRLTVNIADSMYMIGILWIVQTIGQEAILTGITYAIISVSSLFALISGELIDRKGPLLISKFSILIQAILLTLIVSLLLTGIENPYLLVFLIFLASLSSNIFYPASNSLLAYLIPNTKEINKANSLVQSSDQIINLCGFLLAGVLISLLGSTYTMVISTVALFAAYFIFNFIRITKDENIEKNQTEQTEQTGNFIIEFKNGLKSISSNFVIKNILIVSAVASFFVATLIVLLPSIAEKYGDAILYSIFYASFFIGFIIGAIVSNFLRFSGINFSLLWIGNGLSLLPFILIDHWIAICLSILLYGVFSGVTNVHLMTFIQKSIDKSAHGKVFSVSATISGLSTTLGALLAGFFVSYFSYQLIALSGLVLLVLCGFFLLSQSKMRNYSLPKEA